MLKNLVLGKKLSIWKEETEILAFQSEWNAYSFFPTIPIQKAIVPLNSPPLKTPILTPCMLKLLKDLHR